MLYAKRYTRSGPAERSLSGFRPVPIHLWLVCRFPIHQRLYRSIRQSRRMSQIVLVLYVFQSLTSHHILIDLVVGNQYSWSVLQCEPGKFCCRAASDDENCCGKNETIISTSHIGNLLLPGASQAINTTYNATTGQSSSSSATNGSVCTSESNSTACPVDHSATVGGAVGGALGAALIGAFVALAFALRSRNHYKSDLLGTQAVLSSTEIIAAQEKANFQKQLEEHQRQMQTVPPQYPMGNGYVSPTIHGYTSNSGTYSSNFRPAPMEMPSDPNHGLNEMAEENNSRVELKGPSSDAN